MKKSNLHRSFDCSHGRVPPVVMRPWHPALVGFLWISVVLALGVGFALAI